MKIVKTTTHPVPTSPSSPEVQVISVTTRPVIHEDDCEIISVTQKPRVAPNTTVEVIGNERRGERRRERERRPRPVRDADVIALDDQFDFRTLLTTHMLGIYQI